MTVTGVPASRQVETGSIDPGRHRRRFSFRSHVRLVGSYAGARVRGEMQYRSSFAFSLVAQILATAVDLGSIWAVFQATRTIGGWNARQILWLYAVSMSAFGLADLFVSAIEELPEHIRSGRFDVYLLRPSPVLLSVLADGFELRRIGRAVPGVAALAVMFIRPHSFGVTHPSSLLWSGLTVLVGFWIYGALFIATNSVAFWLIDSREVANSFTYGGAAASHYPLDILNGWMRRLYLWIIPVGFVAWLPGTRLLDVPKPSGMPVWLPFCSPVAAMVMSIVSGLVWRAGLRHYESTGS